ncbi:hypothetical protein VNO78_35249 [Psophocarpus tetragonolobus]
MRGLGSVSVRCVLRKFPRQGTDKHLVVTDNIVAVTCEKFLLVNNQAHLTFVIHYSVQERLSLWREFGFLIAMFPLHFHYEDVSRQDPLLKLNHANVMEVPGSCEIRVVPKAPYDFIIKNGKLAMEIPRGQKFIQTQRGSTGKSFRSNPFLGSNKDKGYVSDLARQSTLRGHGMSNFSVRISTVMSLLDSPVEIRENSIQFSMETEFCEFSPELEDHFEIFEHIRGFNVTIVTSANTQDETLPPWSGFLQKDEGETQ